MNTVTDIDKLSMYKSQKNDDHAQKMINELMSEFNNSIKPTSKQMFVWLKRCMV